MGKERKDSWLWAEFTWEWLGWWLLTCFGLAVLGWFVADLILL